MLKCYSLVLGIAHPYDSPTHHPIPSEPFHLATYQYTPPPTHTYMLAPSTYNEKGSLLHDGRGYGRP